MAQEKSRVVVICTKCGAPAPYDPPNEGNPWGTWHWHQPCQHCAAESWGAHDTDRDMQTGRLRESLKDFDI